MRILFLIIALALGLSKPVVSQQKTDSANLAQAGIKPAREKSEYPVPIHRNVIKFNPTPMMLEQCTECYNQL